MDLKKIQDEEREAMFGAVFGVSGPGMCIMCYTTKVTAITVNSHIHTILMAIFTGESGVASSP